MKTTMSFAAILFLSAFTGCQSSARGGSASGDEGFKMSVPWLGTSIKQGETQNVNLHLRRDDSFKRDVSLAVRTSPGISVDPTYTTVRAGDKPDVQLRIAAGHDAALGDYRVYVTGTPETGEPTTLEFVVAVVSP